MQPVAQLMQLHQLHKLRLRCNNRLLPKNKQTISNNALTKQQHYKR
jgi:hypothetical protein